jgi:hypothetical protein
MSSGSTLSQPRTATLSSIFKKALRSRRAAGAAAMLGLLALALVLAPYVASPLTWKRLESSLFGRLAWLTAAVSAGLALLMFREIVRAYRKRLGFPWLPSLSFSASAYACILALHACIS